MADESGRAPGPGPLSFRDWLDTEYPDSLGSSGGPFWLTDMEAAFEAGRRLGPAPPPVPANHDCVLCSAGVGKFCACPARCGSPDCRGPSEGS